jgi:hypothetical protein
LSRVAWKVVSTQIAGTPCLLEKAVVVGGECKSCGFHADSGHPVADEKSRDGWVVLAPWGGTDTHARSSHFGTCSSVLSGLTVTGPWTRTSRAIGPFENAFITRF